MTAQAEMHRITCPYCIVGYADIIVERAGESLSFEQGPKNPRRCGSCGKYFIIKPRLVIEGRKLEA